MPDFYGTAVSSRLLLGTARYPSPDSLADAVRRSGCGIVTVSLRRESAGGTIGSAFFARIRDLGVRILPNTAGCHSVSEAVLTAEMARDLFETDWIKLEVTGRADTLEPDVFGLVEAAEILAGKGFCVFPYTTTDLVVAERLLGAGCSVLMPGCAPIGTAAGPLDPRALQALRRTFPSVPLIVDAGIGRPSHAAAVMEMGFDAVLLNTAVAGAADPPAMAEAFAAAIAAGHVAYRAGLLEPRVIAVPSSPVDDLAVFA